MKYEIRYGSQFKKDIKSFQHKPNILKSIKTVIDLLISGQQLPDPYLDHPLKWEYAWYRECHIKPDVLLIYSKQQDQLVLYCFRIWSHSELF